MANPNLCAAAADELHLAADAMSRALSHLTDGRAPEPVLSHLRAATTSITNTAQLLETGAGR